MSHVGKIYSVLTHLLAEKIYRQVPGLDQVVVWLSSRIGMPIDKPHTAAVQVKLRRGAILVDVADPVREIVTRELEHMREFSHDLAQGKCSIC